MSPLRSPNMDGGFAETSPRRLLGIDRRHINSVRAQRGLVKPAKTARSDQPQRLRRAMPVKHIGDFGSDQEARQPRRTIGAPLKTQKLRGAQSKQRCGQSGRLSPRGRKALAERLVVRLRRTAGLDGMRQDAVL